jgi:hypothetical protein
MLHAAIVGKALDMHPTQTASPSGTGSQPVLPDPALPDPALPDAVKQVIVQRMLRRDPPQRIAALIAQNFQVTVGREQMLACWNGRPTRPTQAEPTQTEPAQTERRQDKEPMQLPADEAKAPSITPIACDAAQDAAEPPFSITPGRRPDTDRMKNPSPSSRRTW